MSKYIKLDIEKLYEKNRTYGCIFLGDPYCDDCPFDGIYCRILDWIESLPTIDIVHCEDCKWFIADKPLKLKDGTEIEDNYCSRPNQQSSFLKHTDFCSYGERKDNE